MSSIQVGNGRGRRQFVKPKMNGMKPFWINADGTVELEEPRPDDGVMEMLYDSDVKAAQAYADKFTKKGLTPCKGCSGKGTITIMRFDSLSIDNGATEETCKLCNGTGIHPDE